PWQGIRAAGGVLRAGGLRCGGDRGRRRPASAGVRPGVRASRRGRRRSGPGRARAQRRDAPGAAARPPCVFPLGPPARPAAARPRCLAGQRGSNSQRGYRLYGRRLLERTPITPGRYEVESEVIVRAARLGFRLTEVAIPTVYGDEESQMRTIRDVPRIVGALA